MQKNKSPVKEQEPNLTVPQIIEYCKNDLGITFDLMSQEKAADFLQKHNYFFRLKQYAEICQEKTKSGKYVGIDFGHLVELSTIDMFFRKLMLKMTIDLEHYLKVKVVNECQNNPADDGYGVVQAFLQKNPEIKNDLLGGAHLAGYSGLGNSVISNCIKVPLLNDFSVMLSLYTRLITSPQVKEKTFEEIKEFFDGRMVLRKEYFSENSSVKNAYQFARAVLHFYAQK